MQMNMSKEVKLEEYSKSISNHKSIHSKPMFSVSQKTTAFMTFSSLRVIIFVLVCVCVTPSSSIISPSPRISCIDSSANNYCTAKLGAGSVCHITKTSNFGSDQLVNGLCSAVGNYTQTNSVHTNCMCNETIMIADSPQTQILSTQVSNVNATNVITTVEPTEDVEARSLAACATGAKQPIFLWVESPNLAATDHAHYDAYFATMRKFMVSNCVGVTVNRVVMKVPYPQYHIAYSATQKIYWPPAASPFFTDIIAMSSKSVKYHLYPMLTSATRAYWQTFGGNRGVGYAVFSFASQWNAFLISKGYAGIEGVVVDYESLIASDGLMTAAGVNALKKQFPGIKFGATIGYDDGVKLHAMDSYTDHFFMQMYDWYKPTQGITLNSRSPFLVAINNAVSISNYLMKTAIQSVLWPQYVAAGTSKVHLMWSLQHANTNCINLQGMPTCGTRNDFGSWSPVGFNAFLVQIKKSIAALGMPALNQLEHGVFHYNSMQTAWL